MELSGSREGEGGPATSTKLAGLEIAGVGMAAVPNRGEATRWDCFGAVGPGSLCSPAGFFAGLISEVQ